MRSAIAVMVLAGGLGLAGQWKTHWTYDGATGAAHWASLDPAYAACNGREQSPIDIEGARKALLPPLEFSFHLGAVRFINNSYTERVNYPAGNGNSVSIGGRRFELVQFHFHHPSEELIHGRAAPMETHFMFRSADGKDIGVAAFIEPGRVNQAVRALWAHMPLQPGPERLVPGLQINPAALLPADHADYYLYTGSLSAPPCTEGVDWYVLKQPVQLSQAQIDAFAALYPHDVRPVQPLNGRLVRQTP